MIPKLRFPEFNASWTVVVLETLSQRVTGHTPNKKYKEYYGEDYNWVSLQDSSILDNRYIYESKVKITELGIKNSSAVLLPVETVIMTRDAGVGKLGILGLPMAVSQHFVGWICKPNLNNIFLYYSLYKAKPEFERIAVGNTIKTIGMGYFKKMKVVIPCLKEQKRISTLLFRLDDKINLLTKKKEALETYKKGLMQKIFSQELRFKRKDGTDYPEWNNSTLDELFTSKKGKGLSLSDIADDGINKCLLYGSLYTKYNEVISRCVEFTNTIESVFANNNDLLVPASTTTSGIDLATFSCLQINDVMIGGDVTILTPLDKQDSRWWAYYLSHHKKTDIAKFAQGSTIVHLYFNHFKKLQVDYPTIEEQRKTVELLIDVDTKISWLQAQISIQLELKKGLLQQMFV